MQARLEVRRFLIAIVFAVTAAFVIGAGLGYTMKGATVVAGPVRVVVVGTQPTMQPGADACIWVGKHKGC
jgi:hypothetical protein